MKYSKDVKNILNYAKETAEDLQRPYICLDCLWYSIFSNHSMSVESIFETMGIEAGKVAVFFYASITEKKPSKRPSSNFNKDVSKILASAQELADYLEQDDISAEVLLLSLFSSKKQSKVFSKLLESNSHDVKDLLSTTLLFISDISLVSFKSKKEKEEKEEEEEKDIEQNKEGHCIIDALSDNEIIEEFAVNLNKKAANGDYDGLVDFGGRLKRVSTILCKTNKPNPILVGCAGGGKTATVEILAREIVNGNVADILKNKVIYEVSLTDMVSGTAFRGDFEERIKGLIDEVKKYDNIILFFDEIHTLIGAGGTGRKGDLEASNILKPYLARGELSCIGATTDYEYNLKFKRDAALDRRFDKVDIIQPSTFDLQKIAPNIISHFEKINEVSFYEGFSEDAINMCELFLPNKKYPDKFVDVVDHCCALSKMDNEKIVTKKVLTSFFQEKAGLLGNVNLIKELNEEFKSIGIKTSGFVKLLKEVATDILDKKKDCPSSTFLYGGKDDVKSICKITESFLKRKGLANVVISAKSLKNKHSISGFSEDYLISLAQKTSILQSPVVIIKDINELGSGAEEALVQILSEGQTTMDNGEEVNFNNVLFLLFGEEQKTKSLGFVDTQKKCGKIPLNIKKVVGKEVFLG